MSASRIMTLEWLRDRNFRRRKNGTDLAEVTDINAHWVVFDHEIDQVPEEIFEEFLRIENPTGVTTLQFICHLCCRSQLALIPAKFFTVQNWTTPSQAGRITPVETAASKANLNLIPWDRFSPSQWVRHIITLHRAAARFEEAHSDVVESDEGYKRLCRFLTKVEKVQKIKQKAALQTCY